MIIFKPHQCLGLALCLLILPGLSWATDFIPVSEISQGMRGYGLTVFEGSRIDTFAVEFSATVSMLACISDAPLYVCHQPGYQPPFDDLSGAICETFKGGNAAGLPGRHIQELCPIGFSGGEVWHIGYQETIALGHL